MMVDKPTKQTKPTKPTGAVRKPLTIRTMLILTAVFASTAASFGYLWRASSGDGQEVGQFVIMTAMMPLLILVGAYWTLKIARRLTR
jgi:hypothetical protein